MTPEEWARGLQIIRKNKFGLDESYDTYWQLFSTVNQIVAAQKERDARIAEEWRNTGEHKGVIEWNSYNLACNNIAAAIRAQKDVREGQG